MMTFNRDSAQLFVPDGIPASEALARTTHMAIGAHQDDLEIMAIDGILACFQQPDRHFCGVVVTDGSGSPRAGRYQDYGDDQMRAIRAKEQLKAAAVGEYGAQLLLDYPSSQVKDHTDREVVQELIMLLSAAKPEILFTHNLADKHDTHVSVALSVIQAVRSLPAVERPRLLLGCEVWRDLDWMVDSDKITLATDDRESLQAALLALFDSQISGGKRYDLAAVGRRRANATYFASHTVDTVSGMGFAMDLTPLAADPSLDISQYVQAHISRFAQDVAIRMARLGQSTPAS